MSRRPKQRRKSTAIRAYEFAATNRPFLESDRCQWTPEGDFPEVELSVHIPDGMQNVDAKWKMDQGGLRIVRSRWQWRDGFKKIRQTWDPEANGGTGEWAEDGKAGGADNVFTARLPKPLRVDALQDASSEHDELLRLITEPAIRELKLLQASEGSPLRQSIEHFVTTAMVPVEQYQAAINSVGAEVHSGFNGMFPELDIHIRVGMEPPTIDPGKLLLAGSSIRFKEGLTDTGIKQQGTGSRRAIFWTLLQVRNGIVRQREAEAQKTNVATEKAKTAEKLNKSLEKEQIKGKPSATKVQELLDQIHALEEQTNLSEDELAFPGYILLLDEPENCLHPMAVRAARNHLYALAKDPNWQIMLSTHSPYFIDPLADHTTIVRLERSGQLTSPQIYRTQTAGFSQEEKENLRALLQMDSALTEMFFGSYPIVVEGDTELAAFVASILEAHETLGMKATAVAARGKALIAPIIKLLAHFEIPFGVLHDSDSPRIRNGNRNSAWSENLKIASQIESARSKGLAVIHRLSIPDFERQIGIDEGEKDKPLKTYQKLHDDVVAKAHVQNLFKGLIGGPQHQPIEGLLPNATAVEVIAAITEAVRSWAAENAQNDGRFLFDEDPVSGDTQSE